MMITHIHAVTLMSTHCCWLDNVPLSMRLPHSFLGCLFVVKRCAAELLLLCVCCCCCLIGCIIELTRQRGEGRRRNGFSTLLVTRVVGFFLQGPSWGIEWIGGDTEPPPQQQKQQHRPIDVHKKLSFISCRACQTFHQNFAESSNSSKSNARVSFPFLSFFLYMK